MLHFLRSSIGLSSPIRILYHRIRGFLAHHMYRDPAHDMIVIGITGTKGKSTTTNIIARALELAGKKVCMFSTVNLALDGEWSMNHTKMTSADPFVINSFLDKARSRKCEYAVIEVSSHALFYNRMYGIDFDVAVFTNLSQDHLDLHGNMEEYAKTKLKLFEGLSYGRRKKGVKKVGVVNIDDAYADQFMQATVDSLYTFGKSANAQVRAQDIEHLDNGTRFTVKMPSNSFQINTELHGLFNVSNILAAVSVLVSQKIESNIISEAIAGISGIPGRLEEVKTSLPCRIFVDYAHTEESLKQVLLTLRSFPATKRIITLFGATGDRDRSKRPKMGAVVHAQSDVVLLTEDDNYSEDQFRIMNEVAKGIKRKEGEDFWIIFHREDAIRTALLMAQAHDVVLVAWKWAETSIIRNSWAEHWSDKEIILKVAGEIERNRIIEI